MKTIRKEIRESAVNTGGSSFFGQSLAWDKTVSRMSKLFLEEFTDLLSTELDLREVYIENLHFKTTD